MTTESVSTNTVETSSIGEAMNTALRANEDFIAAGDSPEIRETSYILAQFKELALPLTATDNAGAKIYDAQKWATTSGAWTLVYAILQREASAVQYANATAETRATMAKAMDIKVANARDYILALVDLFNINPEDGIAAAGEASLQAGTGDSSNESMDALRASADSQFALLPAKKTARDAKRQAQADIIMNVDRDALRKEAEATLTSFKTNEKDPAALSQVKALEKALAWVQSMRGGYNAYVSTAAYEIANRATADKAFSEARDAHKDQLDEMALDILEAQAEGASVEDVKKMTRARAKLAMNAPTAKEAWDEVSRTHNEELAKLEHDVLLELAAAQAQAESDESAMTENRLQAYENSALR